MEVNEAIGIVTKYIYVRKNERVIINPYKVMNQDQIDKLNHAVNVALDYFNSTKIIVG